MASYRHDDFRVVFSRSDDSGYDVDAIDQRGSVTRGRFDARSLDGLVGRFQSTNEDDLRNSASASGRALDVAQRLGQELGYQLFGGEVGEAYNAARALAASEGRGLRLLLSMGRAPDLLSLPWELLYVRPTFVASQRRTPIVRSVEGPVHRPQLPVDRVRILGVAPSSRGSAQIDVAAERTAFESALDRVRRWVDLDWLDPPTPEGLRDAIRRHDYHILHFIGQSGTTPDGEAVLYLEGEDGDTRQVDGSILARLIEEQRSIQLLVMARAEPATRVAAESHASIPLAILRAGVQAVVAMQFPTGDRASALFCDEFYTNLIARQDGVDAAVSEARKALFTEDSHTPAWAAPALYIVGSDAELFRFANDAVPVEERPLEETLDADQPEEEAELPRVGRTPLVHDQPAREDQLGRKLLAVEVATLVQDLAADADRPEAFAVHLDAPWGAGKSTLIGFIADELRHPERTNNGADRPSWTTIQLDAWRSSQLSPAWWALLNHLKRGVRDSLGFWGRRLFDLRHLFREAGRLWRIWLPALVVIAVLVVIWMVNADVNATIAAITTVVAFIAAIGSLGTRLFSLGSIQGARLHERLNESPMDEVVEQIRWIRAQSKRPILLVLDDLDRCNEVFAVELLDAVQTLLRAPFSPSATDRERLQAFVVIAVGDRRWLRAAYEQAYSAFAAYVTEPGRPLGHLFLDKLFQVRIELPHLSRAQVEQYVARLLQFAPTSQPAFPGADAIAAALRDAPTSADGDAQSVDDRMSQLLAAAAPLSPAQQHDLAGIALEARRQDPRREARQRHLLEEFAELLEPNPRAAKRFLMAYNLAYATRLTELEPIDSRTLALWTVVTTRWPALTDWVVEQLPDGSLTPTDDPNHVSQLLRDAEVRRVVTSAHGGPLDRPKLLRCAGYPAPPDTATAVSNEV